MGVDNSIYSKGNYVSGLRIFCYIEFADFSEIRLSSAKGMSLEEYKNGYSR